MQLIPDLPRAARLGFSLIGQVDENSMLENLAEMKSTLGSQDNLAGADRHIHRIHNSSFTDINGRPRFGDLVQIVGGTADQPLLMEMQTSLSGRFTLVSGIIVVDLSIAVSHLSLEIQKGAHAVVLATSGARLLIQTREQGQATVIRVSESHDEIYEDWVSVTGHGAVFYEHDRQTGLIQPASHSN